MIVRCGRCGSQFDVPGVGRHVCPTCGTPNDVRATTGANGLQTPPPPPPAPDRPSPRVICPGCGYKFIVGSVEVAPCPNCGEAVTVSSDEGEEE
ncbi:MAG: hypothetical protein WD184_05950 [Acidimicrobiia bacterium]